MNKIEKKRREVKESSLSLSDIIQWKIREAFLQLFGFIKEKNEDVCK